MKAYLSPKELAVVIGVSESSLRRWADEGLIAFTRTAGGHRRIAADEAVRFIRTSRCPVARPEILGLQDMVGMTPTVIGEQPEGAAAQLRDALIDGDRRLATGLILSWYLAGENVASICDGPIRIAMTRTGELWLESSEGVFTEHRATDICISALHQISMTLGDAGEARPAAVGGAPEHDQHGLTCLMACVCLSEVGYRVVNLGAHCPPETILDAARAEEAALTYWSATSPTEPESLHSQLLRLREGLEPLESQFMIGGRRMYDGQVDVPPDVHVGRSMGELAAFARGVNISWKRRHRE